LDLADNVNLTLPSPHSVVVLGAQLGVLLGISDYIVIFFERHIKRDGCDKPVKHHRRNPLTEV
jgi:hypothetical protein